MFRGMLKVVASVGLAGAMLLTVAPGVAQADVAANGTAKTSAVTQKKVDQILSQFTDTKRTETATQIVVSFSDLAGKKYEYAIDKPTANEAPAPNGVLSPQYHATWTSWKLNRQETHDLAVEAGNYALIYALGAALGCAPCAVGAAIEAHWGTQANNYYNRGKCAEIKYWLAINEYNSQDCR